MAWSKYAEHIRNPRLATLYNQEMSKWYIPDDVELGPDRETDIFLTSVLMGIPTPPITLLRAEMTYAEGKTKVMDVLMDGIWRLKTLMQLWDENCPWYVYIADSNISVLNRKPLKEEALDYIPIHCLTDAHKLWDYQKLLQEKGYNERSNVVECYKNSLYDFVVPVQLFVATDERATALWAHAHKKIGRYNLIREHIDHIVFKNPKIRLPYH